MLNIYPPVTRRIRKNTDQMLVQRTYLANMLRLRFTQQDRPRFQIVRILFDQFLGAMQLIVAPILQSNRPTWISGGLLKVPKSS